MEWLANGDVSYRGIVSHEFQTTGKILGKLATFCLLRYVTPDRSDRQRDRSSSFLFLLSFFCSPSLTPPPLLLLATAGPFFDRGKKK